MTKMLAKLVLGLFATTALLLPTSLVLRQPSTMNAQAQAGASLPPPKGLCTLPTAASGTTQVVKPPVRVDSAALLLLERCTKEAERNQRRQIKQIKLISSPTIKQTQ